MELLLFDNSDLLSPVATGIIYSAGYNMFLTYRILIDGFINNDPYPLDDHDYDTREPSEGLPPGGGGGIY